MITNAASYQPGGSNYSALLAQFGRTAADAAAQAAATGDIDTLNYTLSNIRRTSVPDVVGSATPGASTFGNFWDQITTDPLSAPLDMLNSQIAKAVGNTFKNPWVLLAVAALVFHLFGGFTWLSKKLK